MRIALTDVLMDGIVGDEPGRGGAVALRIKDLVVVIDAGQKSGAGLHFVLVGYTLIGKRRIELHTVGAGAVERILKCDGQGRLRRLRGLRLLRLDETTRGSQCNEQANKRIVYHGGPSGQTKQYTDVESAHSAT